MDFAEPLWTRRFNRWLLPLLLLLPVLNVRADAVSAAMMADHIMTSVDDGVKERLLSLDQELVRHRYDAAVRSVIQKYLANQGDRSARIVGRFTRYFPLFERELARQQLPDALKVLPITESALEVKALSRVGALGLWQLMPGTAREQGLLIDDLVDERLDPQRATEAGITYLLRLYNYFDDWALALAAYNSGPGNVRKAIRRGRSRDFWKIRKYLPRETRSYVPIFIAATYLTEYYHLHGIEPDLPHLDLQFSTARLVEKPLSFHRIAQVTGLPMARIRELNPAYLEDFLPGYPGGHYLHLPRRVWPAMTAYLSQVENNGAEPARMFLSKVKSTFSEQQAYTRQYFTVEEARPLQAIAEQLGVPPVQLATWNSARRQDTIAAGTSLVWYRILTYAQLRRSEVPGRLTALPRLFFEPQPLYPLAAHEPAVTTDFVLLRPMRLSRVADRWPELDLDKLLEDNQMRRDRRLPAGSVVRIGKR